MESTFFRVDVIIYRKLNKELKKKMHDEFFSIVFGKWRIKKITRGGIFLFNLIIRFAQLLMFLQFVKKIADINNFKSRKF